MEKRFNQLSITPNAIRLLLILLPLRNWIFEFWFFFFLSVPTHLLPGPFSPAPLFPSPRSISLSPRPSQAAGPLWKPPAVPPCLWISWTSMTTIPSFRTCLSWPRCWKAPLQGSPSTRWAFLSRPGFLLSVSLTSSSLTSKWRGCLDKLFVSMPEW